MLEMEELIAHYADIDTRRAMGFLPRRMPKSELIVLPTRYYTFYDTIVVLSYDGPLRTLCIDNDSVLIIGLRGVTFYYDTKIIKTDHLTAPLETIHPDFNDDGSFKRAAKAANDDISSL